MSVNTLQSNSLLYVASPTEQDEDTQAVVSRLTHELAARQLDTRFLDALERGEIEGDILVVDEQGNEIKNALPAITIFDI